MIQQNKITQEIAHKLIISHKMQQSLKILTLSFSDLFDLARAMEDNPFLEVTFPKDDSDEYFYYKNINSKRKSTDNDEAYDVLEHSSVKQNLREHIIEQINLQILDPLERKIAIIINSMLDVNGYIYHFDVKTFGESLNVSEDYILSILKKLQIISPAGVFARNLSECLELQLKDKNLFSQDYKVLLENLDLIANLKFHELAKICSTSLENILAKIKFIKTLNPKPGLAFFNENVPIKHTDLILYISPENELQVILTSLPTISLQYTKEQIINRNRLKQEKEQEVHEQYIHARELVKAISRRNQTLLLVAQAIIEAQKNFFLRKTLNLMQLTLEQIAKITGMHISTISKTVANKSIATKYGVFELKDLFQSGLCQGKNLDTTGHIKSSAGVKDLIKELLRDEANQILSDQDISDMLKSFKVYVSRRTVAKYRQVLKIPSLALRKRLALISNKHITK